MSRGLSARELDTVFPFHLTLDRALRIIAVGPSLARVRGDLVGAALDDHFEREPAGVPLTSDALLAASATIVILRARRGELVLKGQLVGTAADAQLVFLCTPRIRTTADIDALQLTLGDFSPVDQSLDFVVLANAQELALRDVRRLSERLDAQRRDLRLANRRLTIDFKVTRILAEATDLDGALDELLPRLVSGYGCRAASTWVVEADHVRCTRHVDASGVTPSGGLLGQAIARGDGLVGVVGLTGEPLWLPEGRGPADGVARPGVQVGVGATAILRGGHPHVVVAFDGHGDLTRPDDALFVLSDLGSRLSQFVALRDAAAEIARREAVLSAIAATAPLGICVVGADDRVVYANPAFRACCQHGSTTLDGGVRATMRAATIGGDDRLAGILAPTAPSTTA